MSSGAGMEAVREFDAARVVNPRAYARGKLVDTFAMYPHLGPILPAVGYYPQQLRDLEATINDVPADVVVSATPFSLGSLLKLNKPVVQITYELGERGEPRLSDLVKSFLWKQGLAG
jgi:predicted GTPase